MHGPYRSKQRNEMATAIAKIIRDDRRYPEDLQTDIYTGKEFYNIKLLKKHNINYYSIYSIMKASVVKRFNRIEKRYVETIYAQIINGNYKWKL